MPTYVYACTECGHQFEAHQAFSDASLTECPTSSGRLRKVFNSVGIVFKGSGFYRNDSREKVASGSGSSDKAGEKSSDTSSSEKSGDKGDKSGDKAAAKSESSSAGSSSSGSSGSSGSGSGSGSGTSSNGASSPAKSNNTNSAA